MKYKLTAKIIFRTGTSSVTRTKTFHANDDRDAIALGAFTVLRMAHDEYKFKLLPKVWGEGAITLTSPTGEILQTMEAK